MLITFHTLELIYYLLNCLNIFLIHIIIKIKIHRLLKIYENIILLIQNYLFYNH